MPFPDNFPDELILEIFKRLTARDLTRANQVSKKWQAISNDNNLWNNLLADETEYEPEKYPKEVYQYLHSLNSLQVERFFEHLQVLINCHLDINTNPGFLAQLQLDAIVKTRKLLKKIVILDTEKILSLIKPFTEFTDLIKKISPIENEEIKKILTIPKERAAQFTHAILLIPEFRQKLTAVQVAILVRAGISPKLLLEGNEERFDSESIYNILSIFANYHEEKIEIVIELLETPIMFQKLGRDAFSKLVTISIFAKPLLEKPDLLQHLSCEDFLVIIESLGDQTNSIDDYDNIDDINTEYLNRNCDFLTFLRQLCQQYKCLIEARNGFTEDLRERMALVEQIFTETSQELENAKEKILNLQTESEDLKPVSKFARHF